jgi:hypothetical protein
MGWLLGLLTWAVLSVPVSMVVGRLLAGKDDER